MILGLGEGGMAFDERLAGRLQAGPLLLTEVENRSPGRPRVGVGLSSGWGRPELGVGRRVLSKRWLLASGL